MNSTSRNRLSEKERYKKLNKKQRKKTLTPSQQGLIQKEKFTSVMRKVLKVQTRYMLYLFFFNFLIIMFILCYLFDQKSGLHLLVTLIFHLD